MGKKPGEQSSQLRKGRAAITEQRSRRPSWPVLAGLAVVVVLVLAIVFTAVKAANEPAAVSGPVVPPKGAVDGALVTGQADAPVKLEVYADYMCPYCGRFERANGDEIARLIEAGTARQHLYPLAFLDEMSNGTRYSTRAANAATTVYDQVPDKLLAFNNALYERQPAEGSKGLSDEEIADLARQVGVPASIADSLDEGTFEPWVAASNQAAFDAGLQATPTVKINGVQFEGDLYSVGPLTTAINEAAK